MGCKPEIFANPSFIESELSYLTHPGSLVVVTDDSSATPQL